MLDRSSFSKPGNMQEAYSRLRRNAGYFRVNYLIVAVLTIAGSFITHPSSLLVLAGLLALWVYMFAIKQGPLVIGEKEFRWVRVARETEGGSRETGGGRKWRSRWDHHRSCRRASSCMPVQFVLPCARSTCSDGTNTASVWSQGEHQLVCMLVNC